MADLKELINQYHKRFQLGRNTADILQKLHLALKQRVDAAFVGQEQVPVSLGRNRTSKVWNHFPLDTPDDRGVPQIVYYCGGGMKFCNSRRNPGNSFKAPEAYKGVSKDFRVALQYKTDFYFQKIKNFDLKTIKKLTQEDENKAIGYIRIGMGQYLHNTFFKTQSRNTLDYALADIRKNDMGDEYLFSEINRNPFENGWFEDNMLEWVDHRKRIDLQHKALFWKPGEPFNGHRLVGGKSDRAVYISFFYAYLRRSSNAGYSEIAQEIGVSPSAPNRDWLPHKSLAEVFDLKRSNISSMMIPVYFSPKVRGALGLNESTARCYRGDCSDEAYQRVEDAKKVLWRIYMRLCDPNLTHNSLTLTDNLCDERIGVRLEMTTSHALGLKLNKGPCNMVHVTC